MDGTGEVQKPIEPGETFEYRFEVPDAGTFWYHSHHNETVQMERGMNNEMHLMDKPVMVGELQVWEVANTSLMPCTDAMFSFSIIHF